MGLFFCCDQFLLIYYNERQGFGAEASKPRRQLTGRLAVASAAAVAFAAAAGAFAAAAAGAFAAAGATAEAFEVRRDRLGPIDRTVQQVANSKKMQN